jgi:hypothetical protein
VCSCWLVTYTARMWLARAWRLVATTKQHAQALHRCSRNARRITTPMSRSLRTASPVQTARRAPSVTSWSPACGKPPPRIHTETLPMECTLHYYFPVQVIADSQPGPNGEARPFYDFLESCLRHKAEMVIFEAARAICNLRDVTARELSPAITVLQLFLSSSKPVLRFAAGVCGRRGGGGAWGMWQDRGCSPGSNAAALRCVSGWYHQVVREEALVSNVCLGSICCATWSLLLPGLFELVPIAATAGTHTCGSCPAHPCTCS